MGNSLGRLSNFKPEYIERASGLFAQGKSIKEVAADLGIDLMTLAHWREQYPSFDSECTRAMNIGFDVLADQLIEIPEQIEDVNRARLKSDNIKWLLARRGHAKYGDRLEVNVNQIVDIRSALDEAKRRALPASYQVLDDVTQHVVTKELSHAASTDSESVVPEIRDADANSLEELLK